MTVSKRLTLIQRITKLWAAALTLEAAATKSLEHLPPAEKKNLERALKTFRSVTASIHSSKAP